jgi:hypothetical protein
MGPPNELPDLRTDQDASRRSGIEVASAAAEWLVLPGHANQTARQCRPARGTVSETQTVTDPGELCQVVGRELDAGPGESSSPW